MKKKAKLRGNHWDHLLHLAEELNQREGGAGVSLAELRLFLGSASEAFRDHAEPAQDYPSYALYSFLGRLEKALGEADRGVPLVNLRAAAAITRKR